ncbi:DUF4913 domain-containing protein [Streptomyces hygroscopicus subsp. sporocinereus]|uniref:DUF4913 domain-containing protein n=1 Tax=Streptomyces hygroscopicus TaxID=1912 RepID=A0ABQ3U322_STRHY|nr:DUF4913 domain-containing protein [Streptomyces hygroscopicus]GHJ30017.1 DUF4913 domain-containing protein [Streptomyces hygroscopicus]
MADDRDFEVPMGMFQDLEDLKAQVTQLTAQVKALTAGAAADPGEALADDETTAGGDSSGDRPDDGEEWQYPPFILLLDPPAYDDELRALVEWVEGVLVPGYLAEPSADARWCHLWTEHTVAIARLHALWLAWQECTDPASCGYTGPSVWHRDHYDPCMRELRASNGPFQGCTKGEHQVEHRLPARVPSAWNDPGHGRTR